MTKGSKSSKIKASETITVKLIRSSIKSTCAQKATVTGLGLTCIGSQRKLENTPLVRGMVKKVIHLLEVNG